MALLAVTLVVLMAACGDSEAVPTAPAPPTAATTPATSMAEPAPETTTTLGDPGLRVIVRPDSAGDMPADVELGCPGGPTFPATALESTRPLEGSDLEAVTAAARQFLDDGEGQFWPQDDWQILHETDTEVLLVHYEPTDETGSALEENRFSFMTVERVNGTWKWAGSSSGGPCPLQTRPPQGLNTVNWRIDPSAGPLTPNSTQIEVLVTERECASGQAMGDRLLGPEVVMTDSAVLIAFAANPPPGEGQTCPSNPEQAVVVDLSEPLGSRDVLDGLAVAGNLEDFLS